MRPIPRSRHWVAAICLVAVAAAYAYQAALDERLSRTQVSIATAAIKRAQPDLFPCDPIYSEGFYRFHTPAFQAILELTLAPTQYRDVYLPFRLMVGAVTLMYLCGMYVLLYRQCRSWSISAFTAMMSSAVLYTIGDASWGVGSLGSMTPASMVQAIVPLIVLAYLRYQNQWRVTLVFLFIGVCGNLQLVTSMNLTLILLGVYLGTGKFAPRRWPMAMACAAAAIIGALPYTAYYLMMRQSMVVPGDHISAAAVWTAFRVGDLPALYPDLLKSLLYWALMVAALAIPAATVLARVERFRVRDMRVWVWFIVSGLFVALGLHGISQGIGVALSSAPMVIDFSQASSLVMLPLYVLFAQALTNIFRLVRTHRQLVRWACVTLMAMWMIPSDNLRVGRYAFVDAATMFMDEADKPRYVQRHHEQHEQREELNAIARWALANSGLSDVFLAESSEFRLFSRRSIVVSSDDVKYLYYLAPQRLADWTQMVLRQRRLMYPPHGRASGEAVEDFVAEIAERSPFRNAGRWYIVLPESSSSGDTGPLVPVESSEWGRHYRLYRLP